MTSPAQIALTVGPLAGYLYLLGVWQSGRSPRVIPGVVDLSLLVLGVGGLLAFGPLGQAVVGGPFGPFHLRAGLFLLAGINLLALAGSPRAFRRLVVYNVEPDALDRALEGALGELPGRFARTVQGFEDEPHGLGLRVETTPRLRAAVVEAYGREPEALIAALRPVLRRRLRGQVGPSQRVAWALFALSSLTMLVPLAGLLLSRPQTREMLRSLLERLQGK